MVPSSRALSRQDTSAVAQASESQTSKFDLVTQAPFIVKGRGRHLQRAVQLIPMSVFNARSELLPWGRAQLSPLTIKSPPGTSSISDLSNTPS